MYINVTIFLFTGIVNTIWQDNKSFQIRHIFRGDLFPSF